MLVVDDQQGVRFLLGELFRGEGFSVAEAGNYEGAINAAKEYMPDIALIDIKLADSNAWDGGDIIKELKEYVPGLIPIVISACRKCDMLEKAIRNGAVYCLEKPFDLNKVIDVVNEQLIKYSHK